MAKSSLLDTMGAVDGVVSFGRRADLSGVFDVLGSSRIKIMGQIGESTMSNLSPEDLINLVFTTDGNWVTDENLKLVRTGSMFLGGIVYEYDGKIRVANDEKCPATIQSGLLDETIVFPGVVNEEVITAMENKSTGDIMCGFAVPSDLIDEYVSRFYTDFTEWTPKKDAYSLRKAGQIQAEVIFKTGTSTGKVWVFPVIGFFNSQGAGMQYIVYPSSYMAALDEMKKMNIYVSDGGTRLFEGKSKVFPGFVYDASTGKTSVRPKDIRNKVQDIDTDHTGVLRGTFPDVFIRFVLKNKAESEKAIGKNIPDAFFQKNGESAAYKPVGITLGSGVAAVGMELIWFALQYICQVEGDMSQCKNPGDSAGVTIGLFSYTTGHQGDVLAKQFRDAGYEDIAKTCLELHGKKLGANDSRVKSAIAQIKASGALNDPKFVEQYIPQGVRQYIKGPLNWAQSNGFTTRIGLSYIIRISLQTGGYNQRPLNIGYVGSECLKYLPINGDQEKEKQFVLSICRKLKSSRYGGWRNEGIALEKVINQYGMNPDLASVTHNWQFDWRWGGVAQSMIKFQNVFENACRQEGLLNG